MTSPLISKTQLAQLQQALGALSPAQGSNAVANALSGIYSSLQNAGFQYAGWANGVNNADTIAGIAALQYLNSAALMGLGAEQCQNLSPQAMDALKIDMAKEYLKALDQIAKDNGGIADRDIKAEETWDIHKTAYDKNGLAISAWTLDPVFRTLEKNGGEQLLNDYWDFMRDTGGTGYDALKANLATSAYMHK